MGGHVGVGELRPTPHTRHNNAARCHWLEVPNPRDTFGELGVELLEESPPQPRPQVAPALPTAGEPGSLACSSLRAALKRSSKFFATTFSSPLPHALITLFDPTSQSRASTSPRSTK